MTTEPTDCIICGAIDCGCRSADVRHVEELVQQAREAGAAEERAAVLAFLRWLHTAGERSAEQAQSPTTQAARYTSATHAQWHADRIAEGEHIDRARLEAAKASGSSPEGT